MNYELNNEMELIERYLDGDLNLEDEARVEQLLSERADLMDICNSMKAAIESVRYAGINKQVADIAKEYSLAKINTVEKSTAKIRSIGFYSMRAAAAVVLVVASYSIIMYTTATPERIYDGGFVPYQLSTTRNLAQSNAIEFAYKNANWGEVVKLSSAEEESDQQTLFLTGMAALQMNQPKQAVHYFQKVNELNAITNDSLYKDESQFYLALSYVKLNDGTKAYQLLQNIRNNPSHNYYKESSNINLLKVKLLSWKNN